MIKLSDASILNLLPETLTRDPTTKALAFAIGRQGKKVLAAADKIKIWSNIDGMDHDILNAVAAELRTPNYLESYNLAIKRNLVKNTIKYYMRAGTPGAMQEIVESIFGSGEVVEWYTYHGQHHHFRIATTNPTISGRTAEEFTAAVEGVKRKSTIFDGIIVSASTDSMEGYLGVGIWIADSITLPSTTR